MLKEKLKKLLILLGVRYVHRMLYFIPNYIAYRREFKIFKATDGDRFSVKSKNKYPCLNDKTLTTGFDKHYIYHPAWAARKLKQIAPKQHIDISSLLDFFYFDLSFYSYSIL